MKRSKCVNLSLAAAVSVAIAGCSEPESAFKAAKTFESVQECVGASIPVDVCSDAYMSALAGHRRIAPVYATKADCEADFILGYCDVDSHGQYLPRLGGFELAGTGTLTERQFDTAQARSGGAGGDNGMLMGLLLGSMLSDGGRYYSEPVYRYHDGRGMYRSSTLAKRIESGKSFPRSLRTVSASTTKVYSGAGKISTASVSRGGFGSQSAARSGWGGSSRGFSFGG